MAGGRLAFLIAYGPEARAFLQSGLAERMAQEREIVLVTANTESEAFVSCPFPLLPLPCGAEGALMERTRAWSRGIRRRASRLAGAAALAERAVGRFAGGGVWTAFLQENGIGAVVAASAVSRRTLPTLQAAANLETPSVVLLNSWRDRGMEGGLPVRVHAVGSVAPGGPCSAIGSLHHAAMRRAQCPSRRTFCKSLALDPRRPVILYATAANDPEEPMRIADLLEALAESHAETQLLIRPNPRDERPGAFAALAGKPGVALLEPRWEWLPAQDWNCPLPDDLPWWRGALEHCALAVGLPSTVSLDFGAWGKPAVNLAWGRGAAAWAERSYAPVRAHAPVLAARSPAEAAAQVARLVRLRLTPARIPADPVDAAAQLIRRAIAASAGPRRAPAATITETAS